MSVPKSERSESEAEFLSTARELEIFTIRTCVEFPGRYTYYISSKLAESTYMIYSYAKKGNSIWPTNDHERQIRRDFFLRALAEAEAVVSQIEIAYELLHYDLKTQKKWSELLTKEIALLKGVIKKDRRKKFY